MVKPWKKGQPIPENLARFVLIDDPDGISQPYEGSRVVVKVHSTEPQVTVWGNDDTGYYKVFPSKADAKTYWRRKIPATITFDWLIIEGFLDWNTDKPVRLPKRYK